MTNPSNIQTDTAVKSTQTLTAKDHDDKIKGAAATVSLSEIEELFSTLENQLKSNNDKKSGDKDGTQKLLAMIQDLVNAMGSGKAGSTKAMADLKGYVEAFSKGDNTALDRILEIVMPAAHLYIHKHPEDQMAVIKAFAPLMGQNGKIAVDGFARASKSFDAFKAGYEADTNPTKKNELAQIMGQIFNTKGMTSFDKLMKELGPTFIALLKQNPDKGAKIIGTLFKALAALNVADPAVAQALAAGFVKTGDLSNLLTMSDADFTKALSQIQSLGQSVTDGSQPASGAAKKMIIIIKPAEKPVVYGIPDNDQAEKRREQQSRSQVLAQAMMAAQMLQSLITDAQTKQDQWSLQLTTAKNKAAYEQMQDMNKKIDKEQAEEAKAHQKHHWWDFLIKALLAVIAVVVAALTAGIGAAIAAALIGIFMATPLMNMTVSAIAKKVSADVYNHYYKEYKKEGKTDAEAKQLAQQKADAVGQLVGQIVCIVAVCVVSFGVGGIEGAGEDAADTALEEGANLSDNLVDDLEDEIEDVEQEVEESTSSAESKSNFKFNGKLGAKMAAFQGLSAVAGTNVWMTAMQTNPEWCKNHKALMAVLDGLAELLTIIASLFAGGSALSEAANGPSAMEQFAGNFAKFSKYLMRFQMLATAGQSVEGVVAGSKQAHAEFQAADTLKDIAKLEAAFTESESRFKLQSNIQKSNLKQTENIIKSEGSIMDSLEDVAGLDTDTVNKALMSS